MTEQEGETISSGSCPVCHHRGFVLGPMAGGINLNIECANVKCRARFNVALYAGRVQYAQRIEKRSEGGPEWPSEPQVGH
jgi:hypothetical protein